MNDMSVLVVSCDRYADVWPVFFSFFWAHWPEPPGDVYLGANRYRYTDPRVKMALTGDDPSWAESTRRMVEQIPTENLLMLLEDFLLLEDVEAERLTHCIEEFQALHGGYLRLKPFPRPDHRIPGHPEIGVIDVGAPYRTALQAAIWRKATLLRLLENGESAWDMELIGSRRSDTFVEGFYSVWRSILHYEAAIVRGRWLPWAVDLCRKQELQLDSRGRPVLSTLEYRRWRTGQWLHRLMQTLPWRVRRPFGDMLRSMNLLPPRTDRRTK